MLNNFELILLDNLIYILKAQDEYYKNKELGKIIEDLLCGEVESSDTTNSNREYSSVVGENFDKHNDNKEDMTRIENSYLNAKTGKPQCGMKKDEWVHILQAIAGNKELCALKIHDVTNDLGGSGFRAATFTSDTENIIIFKGTTDPVEWLDNGIGGYSIETPLQERALDYVNRLDLVNNNPFTVSGHSKGGNLAQYVTLFGSDTIIDKCLSFDGQGFSNELCETNDYKEALKRNQDKMYMVSSSGDYVNVLFNSAILDKNKMYVKANPVGISLVA